MIGIITNNGFEDPAFAGQVVAEGELTAEILTKNIWSPVKYKTVPGKRHGDNFESIVVLSYDIDNYPGQSLLSIEDAKNILKAYKHMIGTTKSHNIVKEGKPAAERFRIVLFFQEPITDKAQYLHNWFTYAKKLGIAGSVDPATKDVARFFYPCQEVVSASFDGALLPVLDAAPVSFKQTSLKAPKGVKGRLNEETMNFLLFPENTLPGTFHPRHVAALFDMKRQNYTKEEAIAMSLKACPTGELDRKDMARINDIYDKREPLGSYRSSENWPEMHKISAKNPFPKPVKDSVANIEYVLNKMMGLNLLYDERAAKVVKNVKFGNPLSETDAEKLRYTCMKNNIMDDPSKLNTIINNLAFNNSYDAFASVFETIKWDGKDRLEALFATLKFREEETPEALGWYKQYLFRWLRAIAAKYYRPGAQNNVLVFVGRQGIGKSRWLDKLASVWPDGYKEGQIDPSNKDHALVHLEKFIWHISELDNTTNNRDVSALKDFLTRGTISERRPYARKADTGKSICSFCASVNSVDFLHDNSGNRRFLILPLIGIDTTHNIDMQQLFAQVGEEFKAGLPWYFDQAEIAQTEPLTDLYKYKDPVTQRIEQGVVEGVDRLNIHDIINIALGPQRSNSYFSQKGFRTGVSNLLLKKSIKYKNHGGTKVYCVDEQKLRDVVAESIKTAKEGVLG